MPAKHHRRLALLLQLAVLVPTVAGQVGNERAIMRVRIVGNQVFALRRNGVVECFDTEGVVRWSTRHHATPDSLCDALSVSGVGGIGVSVATVGDDRSEIAVWHAKSGELVRRLSADLEHTSGIISQDGKVILVAGFRGEQGILLSFDQQAEKPHAISGFQTSMVSSLVKKGSDVWAGTETSQIARLDLRKADLPAKPVQLKERVGRIESIEPLAGPQVAVGTERGILGIAGMDDGSIINKRELSGGLGIREIRFRERLLFASAAETLLVLRVTENGIHEQQRMRSRFGQINSFDVDEGARVLIAGHDDARLSKYEVVARDDPPLKEASEFVPRSK